MIIGFDGSRAFLKSRTGTENYSYQLLKALSLIDTEIYFKVYIRPGSNVKPKEWPANFQFSIINFPRFWTQVGLALQTFKDKLDILFIPSHTLPLIRNPGLKTVMTVHDLGAEYLPGMHQIKQRLYLDFITNFQLKTATKLIAVSKATKEDLVQKVEVDPKRIKVIYEGVDRKVFKSIKDDHLTDRMRQYDVEDRKYFLFVGTIQPRKNLTKLIQAFNQFCHPDPPTSGEGSLGSNNLEISRSARNDSVKLVLVGSKGWLSDEIYKLPKKLGIEDKVKFLGHVPDKVLPSLYRGAIALVFPSLFEGFGLPILEAMACGCPVITSNTSSMPEVAGDAALLVDPYDSKQIEQAMKKIFEDDRLRGNLIRKGFKQVEKFTWEKTARETLKVLENL